MNTLAEIAKALNRPVVYLSGLQSRFELPLLEGAGYSGSYQAFLQTVVHLRTLGIAEDRLRELWDIGKNSTNYSMPTPSYHRHGFWTRAEPSRTPSAGFYSQITTWE